MTEQYIKEKEILIRGMVQAAITLNEDLPKEIELEFTNGFRTWTGDFYVCFSYTIALNLDTGGHETQDKEFIIDVEKIDCGDFRFIEEIADYLYSLSGVTIYEYSPSKDKEHFRGEMQYEASKEERA